MGMKTLITIILTIGFSLSLSSQYADCNTARRICTLDNYTFTPQGAGQHKEALTNLKNNRSYQETNSIWLYWDVEDQGEFVFTLTPEYEGDDIDFTVYKTTSSTCEGLKQIRSVLSGANLPYYEKSEPCLGSTGLNYNAIDISEAHGCNKNQDNFVKYVSANTSERYYILINNYSSDHAFEFDLSGTLAIDNSACLQSADQVMGESLEVHPNPVSDELFITISTSNSITDLSIIDIMGRRVMVLDAADYNNNAPGKAAVKNLINGTYIVRAETSDGVLEQRFVKL